MKYLVVALGITACCVAPLRAQDTAGNHRAKKQIVQPASQPVAKRSSVPNSDTRPVYYITNVSVSGSHLPLVIRRYKGENTPMFRSEPGKVYSTGDIGTTAALDVAGALRQLDPAISSASH